MLEWRLSICRPVIGIAPIDRSSSRGHRAPDGARRIGVRRGLLTGALAAGLLLWELAQAQPANPEQWRKLIEGEVKTLEGVCLAHAKLQGPLAETYCRCIWGKAAQNIRVSDVEQRLARAQSAGRPMSVDEAVSSVALSKMTDAQPQCQPTAQQRDPSVAGQSPPVNAASTPIQSRGPESELRKQPSPSTASEHLQRPPMPRTEGIPVNFGDSVASSRAALGTQEQPLPQITVNATTGRQEPSGESVLRVPAAGFGLLFDRTGRVRAIRVEGHFNGHVADVRIGDPRSTLASKLGDPLAPNLPPGLPEDRRKAIEEARRTRPTFRINDAYFASFHLDAQDRVGAVVLTPTFVSTPTIGTPGSGTNPMSAYLGAADLLRRGTEAHRRGDLRTAAWLMDQSVDEFIQKAGERDHLTLTATGLLARTQFELGKYADAEVLWQRVIRVGTESQTERSPIVVGAMLALAALHVDAGRPAAGLMFAERALRIRTEALGRQHRDTLAATSRVADIYSTLGRGTDALTLQEGVLKQLTLLLGERHPDTMTAMSGVAASMHTMGRYAEAASLYERVLRLLVEVHGEGHQEALTGMNNLAASLARLGRLPDAQRQTEKALGLAIGSLGAESRLALTLQANLVSYSYAAGDFAKALPAAERSLRQMSALLGEQHPDTLKAMSRLARCYVANGRLADAANLHSRYVAGAERQRSQPGLSDDARRALFQTYAVDYRLFSSILAATGRLPEAFHLSELSKARTLLEGMTAQVAQRSGVLPEADRAALEKLQHQLAALTQQVAGAVSAEARQNLEAIRNEVGREFEQLQARLKAQHPKYAHLTEVNTVDLTELRSGMVPSGTVVVSFGVAEGEVQAFVVGPNGSVSHRYLGVIRGLDDAVELVRLGYSERRPIREILAEGGQTGWKLPDGSFRVLDAKQQAPQDARPVVDVTDVAQMLASRLLKPLVEDLKSNARWIISPDGALAQLAFEVLPFGPNGEPAIHAADIHYTQSLSVHALSLQLQLRNAALTDRQDLFAMGHAEYSPRAVSPRERRNAARSTSLAVSTQLKDLDALWADLPGTEVEVKSVAGLFPGSSQVFLRAQATEQQLQAMNSRGELRNFRYLLFSAHGYVAPDRPALSSIVLGIRQRTPEADGYVTASEWTGYDLRSDIAMLSACDTGLGKVVVGEGVMGLPFALFIAGNVNTVLTLWPVEDAATAEFVREFFAKVKSGRSASQALAATKREFTRHPKFNHPRFWAPFVLIGAG